MGVHRRSRVLLVVLLFEFQNEVYSKKLEFTIYKPETDLKKIDIRNKVKNNKINDMNNEEVVHPSDDITNDDYNNIETMKLNTNGPTETIVFIPFLITHYN